MKQTIICFFLFIWSVSLFSQDIPRDTSFNLRDDYAKNIKKFPELKPIAALTENIDTKKNIVYSSKNGRNLHLDVYKPIRDQATFNTVIMIHGGGWRSGNKEMMESFATHLCARGYIVVVPEYRLSLEAIYPAGINDLKEVVAWCYKNNKKHQINTKHIGIMGTSSGAQMASQLGNNIKTKYQISATVNIDGVLAFRHPQSTEGAVAIQWLGGTYEEATKTWIEASAMHNVNKKTAPVLFIGSSMPRFHAGRDDMIEKLNALKIANDTLVFDHSPHTFWFYEPWFSPMLDKITSFLNTVWEE